MLRTLLMVALLVPALSFAQKKVPIEVSFAGEGGIAPSVAHELREAIRTFGGPLALPDGGSSAEAYGMRVTTELAKPRIRLQLASFEGAPADATPIAVTVLYDSVMMPLGGAYIRSIVITCGTDTAACAKQILAKVHGSMEWLRERWPSIWNTL